ncbi:MAG: FhaA domain-containing protein, partial [Tepidisphaerales bacterium]
MSNQRGLVQRIERRLENTVGDAFARVFGGSIVPQEVEAALRGQASAGVQALPGEHFLAPNEYVITLSASDFEKVSADRDLTTDTFAKHLGGYIRDQGWQTYGDVVVRFEQSPSLHTGQYRARGVVNPDVDPHPSQASNAPPQPNQAYTAEPGVPAMSDNPTYRGDQGQGRPGDDYYDDRYPRPQDEQRAGAPEQRGPYPPEQGGYAPPPSEPGYGQRQGYPEQGGYGGGQGY